MSRAKEWKCVLLIESYNMWPFKARMSATTPLNIRCDCGQSSSILYKKNIFQTLPDLNKSEVLKSGVVQTYGAVVIPYNSLARIFLVGI